MVRCLLAEDYDKTRYEIDMPLTSKLDYATVRKQLGIPDYVDRRSFLMERGLVAIWAAQSPGRLAGFANPPQLKKIKNEPIPALLFGGGAVKLLSKTANDPRSGLCREIGDLDFISSKQRAQNLYKLLLILGETVGSRYYHFVTLSDQRFNANQSGKRYRVRAIDRILDRDTCKSGTVDIFTDQIDLRHRVDVRNAFNDSRKQLYTIGPANVLLAKCQYILDTPKSDYEDLVRYGLEYRILKYPEFRASRLLIGMEDKDLRDVCAILLDYDVGEGDGMVDTSTLANVLGRDSKFALTFRLNIESLLRNEKLLKEAGVPSADIERIFERANAVLDAVPTVDKKWSNPWWNEDVETPKIFGKKSQQQELVPGR